MTSLYEDLLNMLKKEKEVKALKALELLKPKYPDLGDSFKDELSKVAKQLKNEGLLLVDPEYKGTWIYSKKEEPLTNLKSFEEILNPLTKELYKNNLSCFGFISPLNPICVKCPLKKDCAEETDVKLISIGLNEKSPAEKQKIQVQRFSVADSRSFCCVCSKPLTVGTEAYRCPDKKKGHITCVKNEYIVEETGV
jgi:hypothetical protein